MLDPDRPFDTWFEAERATVLPHREPGLIRFFARPEGADAFTLTLSFHHAIIDGWSLSLFVRDLVHGLTGERTETPPVPAVRPVTTCAPS